MSEEDPAMYPVSGRSQADMVGVGSLGYEYWSELDEASKRVPMVQVQARNTEREAAKKRREELVRTKIKAGGLGGRALTERELQVIAGVARGKTNREIARDLGIVEGTVKTHLVRVLEKSSTHSRAEIVSWAYMKGYMKDLTPERERVFQLTPRELNILQYLVMGLTNERIGQRTFLSVDTIKTYVIRLLRKMKATNRAHLTAIAWQLKLVDQELWETMGVALTADVYPYNTVHAERDVKVRLADQRNGENEQPVTCTLCGATARKNGHFE